MTYTPPEGVTIGSFTAGTLPASFSAPTDAVVSYKIYGTSEGVGVETENLFDKDATDTNNGYMADTYIRADTGQVSSENWIVSEYIPVNNTEYAGLYLYDVNTTANQASIEFYDANKSSLGANNYQGNSSIYVSIPDNAAYFRASVRVSNLNSAVIKYGSTAPTTYIPFGYKIPILLTDGTSTSNYDLFVGDSKLYVDEYLDFESQKVYKYVDGVLTPTDPPATLPTITATGETTISCTETLGDIELTGDWLAIMGSTQAESIDIGFTVDADEYIAFATVDDGPSIQVSDTITMPSSADSFSLEVVAWGRERYTETVYSALS